MHGYGGVEQLFFADAEQPTLSEPNEVIVKLKAASINHIDIWNRMGATGINVPMPHTLGADGAGMVVEVGAQSGNVNVGDAVCLYPTTGCVRCGFCIIFQLFVGVCLCILAVLF